MRGVMFYFTYGTNLDKAAMQQRCEDNKLVTTGIILDYRLAFFDGLPTIVPSLGDKVIGAIYRISEADEDALDVYEGYPKLYGKQRFTVRADSNLQDYHDVMVYVMVDVGAQPRPASWWVLSAMERGYMDHGLADYLHLVQDADNEALRKYEEQKG